MAKRPGAGGADETKGLDHSKAVRFHPTAPTTQQETGGSRRPAPRPSRLTPLNDSGRFSPTRGSEFDGLYAFDTTSVDAFALPPMQVAGPETSSPRRFPGRRSSPRREATTTATAALEESSSLAVVRRALGAGLAAAGADTEAEETVDAAATSATYVHPAGGEGHTGITVHLGEGRSLHLQTGEDAIAFFARYGTACPVKFVHLNRANTGKQFRPYNLVVVPQSDVEPEHFTMSAKGVVRICPNRPSEFISLSEWMRESTIFNVLTSMRFYKYYLPRKMFTAWRSNIRYNLFCQQRQQLSQRLLLGKQSFCRPLKDIEKQLESLEDVQLMDWDLKSQKTFDIAQFMDAQANCRAEVTKLFDSHIEKIRDIVEQVCNDVSKRARRSDGDEDAAAGADPSRPAKQEKSKSILAAKQEQARRLKALKAAAHEKSMLGDFVRLVDYMVVSMLTQLAINTCRRFLEELMQGTARSKTPLLFETSVRFNDAAVIEFNPTLADFQAMVTSVVDQMINLVSNLQRIVYVRAFKPYVAGLVTDPPTVSALVRDSPDFQRMYAEIQRKFSTDFTTAEEYGETFMTVRPIFTFEHNDDFEEVSRGPHTVTTIKSFMTQIQDWERELEKLKVHHTIGVLHVESRKLKQSLLPITANALSRMKVLLQTLASSKCKELLDSYASRVAVLTAQPTTLKDFASYVEKYQAVKAEDKVLAKNAVVVDEMYRLLTMYEVKLSPEDMVQLDDLRSWQNTYATQSDKTAAFLEERMPEMTRTLDMRIIKLNEQLAALSQQLLEGRYVDASANPAEVLAELDAAQAALTSHEEASRTYIKWQGLFSIPPYEFKNLKSAQDTYHLRKELWTGLADFSRLKTTWETSPFLKVDVEELNKDVQNRLKNAFMLDKKLGDAVSVKYKEEISAFRHHVNCIMELGNPSMKERHWEKLYKMLGQPWIPGNESFTLEELMSYGVLNIKESVTEISGTASGEAQLESALSKIRNAWASLEFVLRPHRDSKTVFILGGLDDIFTVLEDNQVTLQTMLGSRYITGVQADVEAWERKLSVLSDTLDEWVACQRNWMYLETIFSAEDIQKQLPTEAAKFQTVDKMWKDVMKKTVANPLVIAALDVPEGEPITQRLGMFQRCNALLEEIQKSLEDYLETKRSGFPRFYFLSNDELLAILSQTRDPQAVQPHMSKCFDSIKALDFGKAAGSVDMNGMISAEDEMVPFSSTVTAVGVVENWLCDVEAMMRRTLYDQTAAALKGYPPTMEAALDRAEWYFKYAAQPVLTVDQIMWSRNVETAIRAVADGSNPKAISAFLTYSIKQIDAMVALVRGKLTKLQRTLLGALVVIDVHARDVVRAMVAKQVASMEDFEWTRQLRYYWEAEVDNCVVRQTNTRFVYGYEYLGNNPRLVITPLTDKCYMTLTGALHLKFGGAPAGPAGTGKTETVKDLGKALAMQCVVFNCSDGLDYKMMGRFFSGLAQAGAWSCFDEFNRIDIEVLSVIAQQILCIQQGLQSNASHIEFEGREMPLSMNFGVFITMNPGYAGRTELPDNLKALFRPVAMMVPDYRLIAEISLFSQGFTDALTLSNKMTQLYKLASEQLSKQDHYDFGMRAVKSVLVAAGQLKRKEPDVNENLLLIRAMRDSNVPKFLEHDLPLFRGIVADLFPGVAVPFVDYGKLQIAIETELTRRNLQVIPSYVTKVIQVHETQLVRHGMMVVGEAGSGKTTNTNILAAALGQLYADGVIDKDGFYKKVERYVLNPKSITMGELYGEFNPVSSEWADGLVASLVRQACADTADTRKWVMFDGPVDALWIENMNTVLDDNKTLCLANGERIKLPPSMHMMFEVQDLAVASPATVSRCGMVYMEQVYVGLMPLVRTWAAGPIRQRVAGEVRRILELIEEHVPGVVSFLRTQCRQVIPATDSTLLLSFLRLLAVLLGPQNGFEDKRDDAMSKRAEAKEDADDAEAPTTEEDVEAAVEAAMAEDLDVSTPFSSSKFSREQVSALVNACYVFAFVWSFGCNVDDASRPKFNTYALKALGRLVPEEAQGADLFSFFVDFADQKMKPWTAITQAFKYVPGTPYFDLLVPTVDTTRYSYLLRTLVSGNYNVLFAGDTGVGKSVIIADALSTLTSGDTATFVSATVNFSAQTKSANLREVLEARLDKRRKNLLGPPSGKQMAMFIDDLNMPALEQYGAQPPIELLRQVIDQGGFYDKAKLFFKKIVSLNFVAACAPPGGGRNAVTLRCTRHFHHFWLTTLSQESMNRIFTSILGGFLESEAPYLTDVADPIVRASIAIYLRVQQEMLPTPAKSHYTFNLRDLSKVFQGMLMTKRAQVPDKDALLRLWLHEESRVFRDRLVDESDRTLFNAMCVDAMNESLNVSWNAGDFKDLLFGDYLSREEKLYREVKNVAKLPDLFHEYLEEYNVTFSNQMHLVFFRDAIAHVSRICRVLRQPRGNALLVGVGGSGRQSLTRLASFIADYKCSSIEITRVYGVNEWHDDLKKMLMLAGIKCKDVVFLFSDTQIVKESFLEDINNLLNAGDVPNLYAPDEMEAIINGVRPLVKAAGKVETRDVIFSHYISLVREHLHIVLAFSPIGDAFRSRCRMFPSLVNCCTIDWFNAWPEDALYSVAQSFLSKAGAELGIDELVDPLCAMCVKLHRSVEDASAKYLAQYRRRNYTTPTSYLELIRLYMAMLKEQRGIVSGKISRYRGGLQKLHETNEMVGNLQTELTRLQPILAKAAEDTADLLVRLAADQKEADEAAVVAAADEANCANIAAEVGVIKDDCQRDLDEALPAYYSALKALEALDKKQIQEVKSFANPPRMVGVVLEAVCLLLGRKQSWDEAKKLMNDMRFLDYLRDYDKDNIKPALIRKLKPYMDDPEFHPDKIKTVSSAATSLCMWVRAMFKYDSVAKTIAPKREKLAEAEANLGRVKGELEIKQAQLRQIEERVAQLKASYEASLRKRDELEQQKASTSQRLDRAHKLTDGLGDEAVRWEATAGQLEIDLQNLVGNIVLSAGCIAYTGPFSADYRADLNVGWVKFCHELRLPVDPRFELTRVLADPVVVREWQIMGLPADDFSTQNGLFASKGRRWPLMIDPQGQANRWVKNMQKDNNLQLIKLSQPDFLRTLENAIRFGQPVLLENVEEELDPALEPVLLKQTFKKGGQLLLHLGDSDIPYSEDFSFFITTKLPNPHYMPEVCIKVTIINFTVTMKGLEDQLLVDVVRYERPDLEKRKDQLIISIASDKKQLKDVEDKILRMLAEASGDILEDEELITNLAASKRTSEAISARMREAEVTTVEINSAREQYRPVATRGSILYFVIADMANVDPMYQYSLQAFSRLYSRRIERSQKSDDLQARIAILIEDLTRSFYVNMCRGLFEVHKLLYSFLIAFRVMLGAGEATTGDMQFLLVGSGLKDDGSTVVPTQLASFLTPKQWLELHGLEALGGPFANLRNTVQRDAAAWKAFAEHKRPELQSLPSGLQERLNEFQVLMVLRVFREEKLVFGIREFVGKRLGRMFMEAPPFDLEGTYSDSSAQSPIVFVLSPGADPIDYLLKLAAAKGKGGPGLRIISLGQGQGPVAEKMMEEARVSGDWVVLQNCHLAVSWLPKLEAILERTSGTNEHEDYRLWLTSMPSPKFPVAILQNSIKLTQEPPRGLKANMSRTFADISEADYESCTKGRAFKKLLFGLAFYHALILERRKFGAIGWNIPYEWMNSDLKTGIMQVRMYLEEQPAIPYETLNAVVGDITYGGRATDAWDKRTNLSILRRYYCPEVMNDSYKFSDSGIYYAPPEADLAAVRAYVDSLPLDDAPETFGLHDNADITLQQKEVGELLSTLISIQPRASSSAGGKTPDETVMEIIQDIESRLPAQFVKDGAHPSTFAKIADGSVNSLGVFCEQEMVRFNKLLQVMASSLKMLARALKGLVVMSSSLETMHKCFLFQLVPPEWEAAAYPSLKPLGSWVDDLFKRLDMIRSWLANGPPSSFWISGFFFPQGFMTGALQVHSRKYKLAVDTLQFRTEVTAWKEDEIHHPPENGVYVYGGFLQGARWDRQRKQVDESHPGELFHYMPAIWLDPFVASDPMHQKAPANTYECPFYKTSRRAGTLSTTGHSTNFIVALNFPSDKPSDHWIRRGVALISQLDS